MSDGTKDSVIKPTDKKFAGSVAEILQRVAETLADNKVATKLFNKLREDWEHQRQPQNGKDLVPVLELSKHDQPETAIAHAAALIRSALNRCCADQFISIELPKRVYALQVTCGDAPRVRPLKSPEHVVGLLAADLGDWIVSPVLAGAERVLRENGYEVLVRGANENTLTEANCLHELSALTQGIISIPVWDGDPHDAYKRVVQFGLPLVFVDRSIQSFDGRIPSVTSDNIDGGFKAARYLIETHKCRRVHVIADYPVSSSHQRIEGFLKAIETAGFGKPPIWSAQQRQGRAASFQWGFRKTAELIKDGNLDPHDGIFALNDNLAAGCRSALEVSNSHAPVIGFDGQHWGAYLSPPLETIFQDIDAMASEAALLLLRRIAGMPESGRSYIPVELRTADDRLRERTP